MFVIAVNKLFESSSNILETQSLVYNAMFDTSTLQKERNTLMAEMDITVELMNRITGRINPITSDKAVYDPEYETLQDRSLEAEKLKLELDAKIQDKMVKKAIATEFFEKFKDQKGPIAKFTSDLWNALLCHIDVYSPNDVRFLFRDGSEIKVNMAEEERKRPELTQKQKEQITEFRRMGLPYVKIGEKMGLPMGQIRSYCLSRIPKPDNDKQEEGAQTYCKTCGKKLEHTPGYKKKIFCSDGCRQDWWNRNATTRPGKAKATQEIICQGCGKKFVAYGTKRKYCSRECYVETMRNR